jgi:hypothetical protein
MTGETSKAAQQFRGPRSAASATCRDPRAGANPDRTAEHGPQVEREDGSSLRVGQTDDDAEEVDPPLVWRRRGKK